MTMTPASNPIQFNGVRIGDTLCRYTDTGRALQVLGVVIQLTENSRGNRVAVLDREFSWNGIDRSNRLTDRAVNHARIRRVIE